MSFLLAEIDSTITYFSFENASSSLFTFVPLAPYTSNLDWRLFTKRLKSDSAGAETTQSNGVTAFGTDGFTVGDHGGVNGNGNNIASWNWKANGAGSANTDGTISSTVSANTTAGFSIVSYTGNSTSGATVGHGLGAIPKWIIVKALNTTDNWEVYHASLGAEKYIELNLTAAQGDSTAIWNDTEPTSSVFSIGNNSGVNTNGNPYIAYCFAEKQGFSKFGSYVGNQSADGTFVYTGFKPAFVLSKDTTGVGESWFIHDNKRNSFNPTNTYLRPNLSNGDGTAHHYDFHSNGFKNRYAGGSLNSSGRTYIYMAFAEQPLVGDNPATAR